MYCTYYIYRIYFILILRRIREFCALLMTKLGTVDLIVLPAIGYDD